MIRPLTPTPLCNSKGGAIYAEGGANLVIRTSVFQSNAAEEVLTVLPSFFPLTFPFSYEYQGGTISLFTALLSMENSSVVNSESTSSS
jgi:hypothetical protein